MQHTVTAIIVAAGSSTRMGFDKLLYPLDGQPVLARTIHALDAHPMIDQVVVVASAGNIEEVRGFAGACTKPAVVVQG